MSIDNSMVQINQTRNSDMCKQYNANHIIIQWDVDNNIMLISNNRFNEQRYSVTHLITLGIAPFSCTNLPLKSSCLANMPPDM